MALVLSAPPPIPVPVFAPHPTYVEDHIAPTCQRCQIAFTFRRRREYCRACGASVCESCSTHRWRFPDRRTGARPQRVDESCFRALLAANPHVQPPPPVGVPEAAGAVLEELLPPPMRPMGGHIGQRPPHASDLPSAPTAAVPAAAPSAPPVPAAHVAPSSATPAAPGGVSIPPASPPPSFPAARSPVPLPPAPTVAALTAAYSSGVAATPAETNDASSQLASAASTSPTAAAIATPAPAPAPIPSRFACSSETDPNPHPQLIYYCRACDPSRAHGICRACRDLCHGEHSVHPHAPWTPKSGAEFADRDANEWEEVEPPSNECASCQCGASGVSCELREGGMGLEAAEPKLADRRAARLQREDIDRFVARAQREAHEEAARLRAEAEAQVAQAMAQAAAMQRAAQEAARQQMEAHQRNMQMQLDLQRQTLEELRKANQARGL